LLIAPCLLAVSRPLEPQIDVMVAAYHLIWTAYGCWLPNDPRGSSSHDLRHDKFIPLGAVHYGRKEDQPSSNLIRHFYQEAEDLLEHQRLLFTDQDIMLIGERFGKTIRDRGYTCYACAALPEHVHLLIRRHRDYAEQMVAHLQKDSQKVIIEAGRRPVNHPVWAGPGWKVFLNTRKDIQTRVKYIEDNPIKEGRPPQNWDFVQEYNGWLPRPNLEC
jgi:REP element-mobilizing transposase RayT